ncbi:ATPase family associated with various cellular activities (AAA) domain-containing protein [Ditylenchus destructor]|uniref:Mitochondrial chaperone BCS1 n=1 Tax=Ditylenchus destructor TaxID=166010 RepID=A0AAD4N669_9BILA|nr:ATPase family associated with various cellular activities (AAA) domain-containing protein [Ditylenchus destructor]
MNDLQYCLDNYPARNGSKSDLNGGYFSNFLTHFVDHPMLFGSIGVTLLGLIGFVFRWIYNIACDAFRQHFMRNLNITNENMAYEWVMDYINKNSKWKTKNLSVNSTLKHAKTGYREMEHSFLPGEGIHYFYYKNQWIQLYRYFNNNSTTEAEDTGGRIKRKRLEGIILTTAGGSSDFWNEFLDEASREGLSAMDNGLATYQARYDCWLPDGKPHKKRFLGSVILADRVMEMLLKDVEQFLNSEKWYHEMGVPYRRGYLLHGPPGTGKTSCIAALASHFGFNICIVSLNDPDIDDSTLSILLNNPPDRSVILFEDIDAAFKKREDNQDCNETDDNKRSKVTLSGILNVLDGVNSCEQRIIFMTTNYKERLDSALIRPGRVDCEQYFGLCTNVMIEKMFKRFYKTASENQCQQFLVAVNNFEKNISPAQLQSHFIVHRDDAQTAIDNVSEIFN